MERALLAFVAFGCCASSGYLLNDLIDLEADRHHPQKRFRPFAAGALPLSYAFAGIPVLLILGCLLGGLVSPLLSAILMLYYAMSAAYTLQLKKIVLLDVLILAGLYTVRIMAGSAAVGIWSSHWLLAFSTFLFFSLSLVKRYGELVIMRQRGRRATPKRAAMNGRRGASRPPWERPADIFPCWCWLSISPPTRRSRSIARSELLWFLCPLLLYWISYVWLTAHRGKMPGDPVEFATGDRTSRILLLLMVVTAVVAL